MQYRPDPQIVAAGVRQSFAWLDGLAWISLLFFLSGAAANISGMDGVDLIGIQMPFYGAIGGACLLSVAHFFVARHVIKSCADAWKHMQKNERNSLFDDIVRTGGIITKGSGAYRDALTEDQFRLKIKTDLSDPPTWVHNALVLLTLLAIVDIEWSLLALTQLCVGFFIVFVNWKIGENWLLCIGDLGSSSETSKYFIDGTARPRAISRLSGWMILGHIDFGKSFAGDVIESFLQALILWVFLLLPFLLISGATLLIRLVV